MANGHPGRPLERKGARSRGIILNCLIDDDLEYALVQFYEGRNITRSAGTRDLLRHALGLISDEYDAGWREGHMAAHAAVKSCVLVALGNVPPVR